MTPPPSQDDRPEVLIARRGPRRVDRFAEADLPTRRGYFHVTVYRERRGGAEHLAICAGEATGDGVPLRVHSECLTSEVLGSLKCDCREQLESALDLIAKLGRGVVLYLRQEGRGIGLGNKIKAYALQAEGLDTYEANRRLGFPDDLRRYDVAAEILHDLGVRSVDIITNNPAKIAGLIDEGIMIRRRIPSPATRNPHNVGYLQTKRERSGHLIDLAQTEDDEAKAG